MELSKPDYEFLDLSDVKDAELSRLECALFKPQTHFVWADALHDVSSCSSSSAGPPTVSSSLDSLSGGEGEMAPHSPQRAVAAPPAPAPPPPAPQPAPYPQPPPTYPHPPPHQQWVGVPPNVYVSQVTANVNVHGYGYMGQYYQPPQGQYGAQPTDRQARGTHRRERRGKRGPSPPPQQPQPYYVSYPPYYPAAQAQGAPLYHHPVYQPVIYPYAYPYYYPDYQPMSVEEGEKGPDEQYPQEMMMEQEAMEAYFGAGHYAPGPPYMPPNEGMEYVPNMYMGPPPPHQMHMPHPPPMHQPGPHHLNVHAKNFIQNSNHKFTPPETKVQELKPQGSNVPIASVSVSVDALPMKDLKVMIKEQESPKSDKPGEVQQPKTSPPILNEKHSPKIASETKPVQNVTDNKPNNIDTEQIQPPKAFPTLPLPAQPVTSAKVNQNVNKGPKGAASPFPGTKPLNKPVSVPQVAQVAIPTQQPSLAPKVPFPNRQRRDNAPTRSPDSAEFERAGVSEHPKREPPLPASKAPVPISISLNAQGGAPIIVTNKPAFPHSRKSLVADPVPPPQPPPPAPTASDFPPPPTPRNRGEPSANPTPAPVHQLPSSQGKSWASLFTGNKPGLSASSSSVSMPSSIPSEEPVLNPVTPTPITPSALQRPIAKVPPYDASPLAQNVPEKPVIVRHTVTTPVISYSEKTSANTSTSPVIKPVSPPQPIVEHKEPPVVKEIPAPTTPVQPSPFFDDPNSYRMGEFLSKYQLDNHTVNLLPRGLTNRSNFCYVNAILQALIACPPFYNMLKALPYQTRRGKSSTPVIDAMVELCYEFTPLSSNGRGARARVPDATAALPVQAEAPLDPAAGQKVLRALRPFPGSQEGRQEDAEEFLGCLLNGLNDEMLELMKLVEPEEAKESPSNGVVAAETVLEEDDDDEWKVMGPKNKGSIERSCAMGRTPLSDIFRGHTRCRLHRTAQQHHVTDAVQPFFTLQLDIERANSVKDALELLAGRSQLEGVTAGGACVDAWQQLSLEQLPVVLILHLKCFQLDSEGHTAKIVKNIELSLHLKIDAKIMSTKQKGNSKQRQYKLCAVVYHEGVEAVKGHYLTDALHGTAGWIRYDDSTVTHVTEAQVLKPKPPRMPYILMYRRQDNVATAPHRPAKSD